MYVHTVCILAERRSLWFPVTFGRRPQIERPAPSPKQLTLRHHANGTRKWTDGKRLQNDSIGCQHYYKLNNVKISNETKAIEREIPRNTIETVTFNV